MAIPVVGPAGAGIDVTAAAVAQPELTRRCLASQAAQGALFGVGPEILPGKG